MPGRSRAAGATLRIRELEPAHELAFLRRSIVELQEIERAWDPVLPHGEEMVDRYCARLLERCREWHGVVLVAEESESPVGLLSIFLAVPESEPDEPAGNHAAISDLLVRPEHRGRGIGAALLARAESMARAAGAPVVRLEVMAENREARAFYGGSGWAERVVQLEKRFGESGG